MIIKQTLNQNLETIDVFAEDPKSFTNKSVYFDILDFPEKIGIGKTTFLIGGTHYLKSNTKLKIELKDSEGNVIYTEPINASMGNGDYKPVSMVVYGNESAGNATITILGQVNTIQGGDSVPQQWEGLYNVKWQSTLLIDKVTSVNTQPIAFYKQPYIISEEVVSPYVTISGSIAENTYTYNKGRVALIGDEINAGSYQSGSEYPAAEFSSSMVGGIVTVQAHEKTGSYKGILTDYTASIVDVLSSTKLKVDPPFSQTSNPPNYLGTIAHSVPDTHNSGIPGYTITFVSASYIETQKNISYAKLLIKDLKTYSGDVDRMKVYVNASNRAQEILIAETKLEDDKLFVTPLGGDNVFFNEPLGKFSSQDFINTHYSASLITYPGDVFAGSLTNTLPTMSYDSSSLMHGLKVKGTIGGMLDYYKLEYSGSPIEFEPNVEYTFKAKIHGSKTSETRFGSNIDAVETSRGRIHIYMSGSAFSTNHNVEDFIVDDEPSFPNSTLDNSLRSSFVGSRIYSTKIGNGQDESLKEVSVNFTADTSASGVPVFYIESGEWTLANIEINHSKETGFSPEAYSLFVPIDKSIDNDVLTFRAEFYNVNNEPALLGATAEPIDFVGGNEVLGGSSNLLQGTMFVGQQVGTGVEIAGVSSGYIRSVGYEGFKSASQGDASPGWLMWSGSILGDSGDNYSGVGLELHAGGDSGSFKFRTDTNELDIRADKFFVGNEDLQFISGADGTIEISSSKFHLTPDEFIIGVGTQINADLSANEIFVPAGTDYSTASASISGSGRAKFVDANIGGWEIDKTKIYSNNVELDSTLSSLIVKDGLKVMTKVGSGSLSNITGSGVDYISNGTFNDTGSFWYLVSQSIDPDGDGLDEWPNADYKESGAISASMFVTSSNPKDDGGQHIRIHIPQSADISGGGMGMS